MRDTINKFSKFDIVGHVFLYAGLVVGAFGVFFSRYDTTKQFFVLVLLIIFYLVWGFAYHYLKGDIHRKLVMEYLMIATIGIAAGFLVLMS